jgi:hypothetical protein
MGDNSPKANQKHKAQQKERQAASAKTPPEKELGDANTQKFRPHLVFTMSVCQHFRF